MLAAAAHARLAERHWCELVANLVEHCFYALKSPPRRVAGDDVVYPPQLLEDEYLPSQGKISAALRVAMDD